MGMSVIIALCSSFASLLSCIVWGGSPLSGVGPDVRRALILVIRINSVLSTLLLTRAVSLSIWDVILHQVIQTMLWGCCFLHHGAFILFNIKADIFIESNISAFTPLGLFAFYF